MSEKSAPCEQNPLILEPDYLCVSKLATLTIPDALSI